MTQRKPVRVSYRSCLLVLTYLSDFLPFCFVFRLVYILLFSLHLLFVLLLSLLVWFVFLSALGLFMFSLHSSFLLVFLSFTFLSVH